MKFHPKQHAEDRPELKESVDEIVETNVSLEQCARFCSLGFGCDMSQQLKCCNIVTVGEMSPAKHPPPPITFPVVSVPLPSIVHAYQPCRWLAVPVTDWRVHQGSELQTGRWLAHSLVGTRAMMHAQLDQTVTLGRNTAELGCL